MAKAKTTQELVAEFCQAAHIRENLMYIEEVDAFAMYQREEGYYKLLDKMQLQRMVYAYLVQHSPKSLTDAQVKDFINQIKYVIYLNTPNMLTDHIGVDRDYLLNMRTLQIEKNDRSQFAFKHLKLPKNGEPQEPVRFKQFLSEVLVDKELNPVPEMTDLVQEMFGYCLMNTIESHVSFFCVGRGGNGKSVLLEVLRQMVGDQFCSSMSVETLTKNNFAAANLVGKLVNVCTEEESSFVKSDKFKAMVSGDTITVERKYQDSFEWRPTVTYVFATNSMPAFSGFNEGLVRRMIIIPFNRRIKKSDIDTNLDRKLISELPQITYWALQGAKRLVENKMKFTMPELVQDKVERFKENISAAVMFFNEWYTVADEYSFTEADYMYAEYKLWCEQRGKRPQNYYNFIEDIEMYTNKDKKMKANIVGYEFKKIVK